MDFPNLKYSPGWFEQKFPCFYTEECYTILAEYFKDYGSETHFEPQINKNAENKGKKRKINHGPCAEFLLPVREDSTVLEGKLSEQEICTDVHSDGQDDSTSGQHSPVQCEQSDDESTGSPVR